MSTEDQSEAIGDELLEILRAHLGDSSIAWASPPPRLHGGYSTENHAGQLDGGESCSVGSAEEVGAADQPEAVGREELVLQL